MTVERSGTIAAEELEVVGKEMGEAWSPDGWEEFFTYDNKSGMTAKAWRRPSAISKGIYEYYASGTAPFSVEQYVKTNFTDAYRVHWDAFCKKLVTIMSDNGLQVVYYDVAYPTPLNNRDYVYYRRLAKVGEDYVYMGRSCPAADDHGYPPQKGWRGNVRVNEYYSQQLVSPVGADKCNWKMQYCDNPGGSIPKAIVNWAVNSGFPKYIENLRKSCEGYPQWAKENPEGAAEFENLYSIINISDTQNDPTIAGAVDNRTEVTDD